MRIYRLILFLFALATLVLRPAELLARPKTTDYSGMIGKLKVQMQLTEEPIMETQNGETYQTGVRYRGYYLYEKAGRHIQVSGVYNALGVGGAVEHPLIELREETDGIWTGYFDGTFDRKGVYSGTWHSAQGKSNLRFVLYPKRAR